MQQVLGAPQGSMQRGAVASTRRAVARGSVQGAANAATAPAATAGRAATRKKLGDSSLLVSECCLGTMTWGCQNTEDEAHEQLSYAFDLGINFMDTAEMYPIPPNKETQGLTDKYIGTWLKKGLHKREDIVLATKVSGYSDQRSYIRGDTLRVRPDQISASVDASLQRLGVDYVDLLQIHWPDRYVPLFGDAPPYDPSKERPDDVPFEEQLRGLQKVVEAGKVRYVGVSNETSWGVSQFHAAAKADSSLPMVQTIQNSYSLLVRTAFETDLAEVCAPRQANVSLLAYSPLAGGSLSGKYISGDAGDGARFTRFPGYMERYNQSLAREATIEYMKIAEKYGLTPSQLALAWCRSRWFVGSTIIGATSMQQLKENVMAFDIDLSEECHADIDAVYRRYKDPAFR